MENKKGQMELLLWFSLLIVIFCLVLIVFANWNVSCIEKNKNLISINGVTDKDSGLFSNGDASRTTLFFDDGEVITVSRRFKSLYLNKNMNFKKCKGILGNTNYIFENKRE
jgi:hypothetical protein